MKTNNLTKKIVAIILSIVMITGLMPYQSFADTTKSYQTPSKLSAKIRKDIVALANFENRFDAEGVFVWAKKPFYKNSYDKKALEIVLPDTIITEKTLETLNSLQNEAKSKGIDILFVIAK